MANACSGAGEPCSRVVAMRILTILGLVAVLALSNVRSARGQGCLGDCNNSGMVTVDEIIRGVTIALGTADLSVCPSFDADHTGRVEVYELVTAVRHTLEGCPAGGNALSTKSSPIAISEDNHWVVAANTDANTVTLFRVLVDSTLMKVQEIGVGREPRSVALLPQKPWAYVANTVSGTVSVLSLDTGLTLATITVGTEP